VDDAFGRHFDCFPIARFYPGNFRIRCNDSSDKRPAIPQSNDPLLERGRRNFRRCLLSGRCDLRRCRGNAPRADDLVPTTRRANHCASAVAIFAKDRRLTSTRRALAHILRHSIAYLNDLTDVSARPGVPAFAASVLLPEFLRVMARNLHVFPSPHGKLHTFSRTIDFSVLAPRSLAYS
jgi:hypothetical protein